MSRAWSVALAPSVVCWAGCASPPGAASGDPLVGGGPALVASANPTDKAASSVPPLPAPAATASNAALASNPGRPLDGRHDLQINDPRSGGASPNWAPLGSGPSPNNGATPQVTLDRGIVSAGNLSANARLNSYEDARAQLNARGVSWFRLESSGTGNFRFSCSVPNRSNPSISRTYEAQAASELNAIQAVLDQIDRER